MNTIIRGGHQVAHLLTALVAAVEGVASAQAALDDADHTLAAAGVAFMAGLVRQGALAPPEVGPHKITFRVITTGDDTVALGNVLEQHGVKGGNKTTALAACRLGYAASLAGVRGMATAKTAEQGARVMGHLGVDGTRALRSGPTGRAIHDFVNGNDHSAERLSQMIGSVGRGGPAGKRPPATIVADKGAALLAHWQDNRGAIIGTADPKRDYELDRLVSLLDTITADVTAVLAGDDTVDEVADAS